MTSPARRSAKRNARRIERSPERGRSGAKKVLLVEDDPGTAEYVIKGLKHHGYLVDHAVNGRDGLFHALDGSYAVIILDRMLPGLDGLSVLASMRSAEVQTPVLILSALGSTDERVKGLQGGSDDYLVKPFAFSELLARLQVLQRRSESFSQTAETVLNCGDLTVDLLSLRVERAGKRVELQPLEFRLLVFLIANRGQAVTRTMMLEQVWEYHFDPHTNVIDALISRLRKKVDLPGLKPLIRTIRGVGYMLSDDD